LYYVQYFEAIAPWTFKSAFSPLALDAVQALRDAHLSRLDAQAVDPLAAPILQALATHIDHA
jgi:hypothetical protein